MRGEIRSLTGLRGIGALIVMGYHFTILSGTNSSLPGPAHTMVDLFFVLSGFVMARTYGPKFAPGRADRSTFGQFLQARFARVYPIYGLIVVCVFLLTKAHITTSASFPVRAFASNVFMLQNLGAGWIAPGFAEYIDPPSWSVSTELGAYLLFPPLVRMALFRSVNCAAALVLVSAGVLLALSLAPRSWLGQPPDASGLDISSGDTLWPLLRCVAGFCIGLVTYRLSSLMVSWVRPPIVDAALSVSFALLWVWNGSDFAIFCLFPPLILQICTDASPLARLFGHPLANRLGAWSYGIYLLHWPFFAMLGAITTLLTLGHAPDPRLLAPFVLALLVIGAACVLYESFEKPARDWLRLGSGKAGALPLDPARASRP